MARFPFSFPNGWYRALYTDELEKGDVKALRYMGRELVAFRDESGTAHLLDAYCAHLGAHLGVGGQVVGSRLRCPFHHWEWSGDGRCQKIPYAKRIPPNARIRAYPTQERNGVLYFWYHAEGEAPDFEVPVIPEYEDPEFVTPWSRTEWTIRTHPQEILENGVDWRHLMPVHKMDPPEGFEFRVDGAYSTWSVGATKSADPLEGAKDSFQIRTDNFGLGIVVSRYVGFFSTLLHLAYTPIDEEQCIVSVGSIGKLAAGAGTGENVETLLDAYMADIKNQIDHDKPIWENKRYQAKPVLCDEDGPIPEYRRWASQFYASEQHGADRSQA